MSGSPNVLDQIRQAAVEDARRLGHGYLGVEHLFLAMLRIEGGVTVRVMQSLGQDPSAVRQRLREHVGRGNASAQGELPPSPRAARVLEVAARLAPQEQASQPGEVHLLVAIVQDGRNAAVRVLQELGLQPEAVRDAALAARRRPAAPVADQAGEEGPVLERGRDLTALAREGRLHQAIGRSEELLALAQTLTRKEKNSPVLIGEAGVGKTAVVEGLAYRIARGDVHPLLQGKRVIELTAAVLVAGTTLRGQFEQRMNNLLAELRSQPDVVVFFDEIHALLGAGSGQGSALDAAQILKPALARGEIRCIGATTITEYRRYIEADAALERRFQPIMINEPSAETTLEILRGVKSRYEEHHQVTIPDEVLQSAVALAGRYVRDRRFPDKALSLVDQACSRTRMVRLTYSADSPSASRPTVNPQTVAEVVAQWTGRPVTELTMDERDRLLQLEDTLRERVIGQEEAIARIASAVRAARAGLKDPARPQAVFLFLGPTGVGKTELARELARFLFGSREAMIRLDMSEYMEKHNVARLIGAPPGYVGHEEEGQLTGKLRTTPHAVVLLDEVEKAHPDVLNLFLQVFEDGRLTDSKGRTVDCTGAIFIMTSNAGSQVPGLFDSAAREPGGTTQRDERLDQELRRFFRPEFLTRIDDVIVFRPLSEPELRQIARLMVEDVRRRLSERGLDVHLTEGAWDVLCRLGYDPAYGARPMRRAVEALVTRPLGELLLSRDLADGDLIVGNARDEGIAFEVIPRGRLT